jgi:hypothetical protein
VSTEPHGSHGRGSGESAAHGLARRGGVALEGDIDALTCRRRAPLVWVPAKGRARRQCDPAGESRTLAHAGCHMTASKSRSRDSNRRDVRSGGALRPDARDSAGKHWLRAGRRDIDRASGPHAGSGLSHTAFGSAWRAHARGSHRALCGGLPRVACRMDPPRPIDGNGARDRRRAPRKHRAMYLQGGRQPVGRGE